MLSFKRKPTFLGIHLDPQQLTCSIVETTNKKQFSLNSLVTVPLQKSEYKNVTLYNVTTIKKHINDFVNDHQAHSAYAVISFAGPGFIERIINLATGVPTHEHLATTKKVVWDYQPIGYTRTTGKTHYYVCAIEREKLLQHQLLANISNINCIQIVPQRVALLKALAKLFPEAWQTATINNHASLQNFIDYYTDQCDTQTIFPTTANTNRTIDKQTCIQAVGNFLCGAATYERS